MNNNYTICIAALRGREICIILLYDLPLVNVCVMCINKGTNFTVYLYPFLVCMYSNQKASK